MKNVNIDETLNVAEIIAGANRNRILSLLKKHLPENEAVECWNRMEAIRTDPKTTTTSFDKAFYSALDYLGVDKTETDRLIFGCNWN